jgi:hypothetical protein
LIGRINRKTIIYKCIAVKGVVAGIVEADAATVVADLVACYCVVAAGIAEPDAFLVVVADIVACYVIIT